MVDGLQKKRGDVFFSDVNAKGSELDHVTLVHLARQSASLLMKSMPWDIGDNLAIVATPFLLIVS